jgi:lipoic acid synthetase
VERKTRLNVLPQNPDQGDEASAVGPGRFPRWLHRSIPKGNSLWKTHDVLDSHRLPTVCEEASCPNLPECYSKKTATFLAMGKECTRNCGFCEIDFSKQPKALSEDEPERLAQSVQELGLKHVVITMVARDDLEDGGSLHLAKIITKVRERNAGVTIEVLTSDFEGSQRAYETILAAAPEIFNHNVETVRELTPRVRHKATYERSLSLLKYMKEHTNGKMYVKSGLMLGLGESPEQVRQTLNDLASIHVDIVTMGHYLQPSQRKLMVKSFVTPEEFEMYAEYARSQGIPHVYAGPFVRSSYNAGTLFDAIKNKISQDLV